LFLRGYESFVKRALYASVSALTRSEGSGRLLRVIGYRLLCLSLISTAAYGADPIAADPERSRVDNYVLGQTTLEQFYADEWNGADPLRGRLGITARRPSDNTVEMILGVCPAASDFVISIAASAELKTRQERNFDYQWPCGPVSKVRSDDSKDLAMCTEDYYVTFKSGVLNTLVRMRSGDFSPTAAMCYAQQLQWSGSKGSDELERLVSIALKDKVESRKRDVWAFLETSAVLVRSQPLLEQFVDYELTASHGGETLTVLTERIESADYLTRIALRALYPETRFKALKRIDDNRVYGDFILSNIENNEQLEAAFWAFDRLENGTQLGRLERELRRKQDPRAQLMADMAKLRLQFASGRVSNVDSTRAKLTITNLPWYQKYNPPVPVYTTKVTLTLTAPGSEPLTIVYGTAFPYSLTRASALKTRFWVSPLFSLPEATKQVVTWLSKLESAQGALPLLPRPN
jgi:hypothetical protein